MSVIRPLTPEEAIERKKLSALVYAYGFDPEKDLGDNSFPAEDYLGQFGDSGELESMIGNFTFDVTFDGHIVPMGGIGGVGTRPGYRRGGAVRRIFDEVFRDSLEKGMVFSVLFPFSQEYYRKFGYESAIRRSCLSMPLDCLKPFPINNDARLVEEGHSRDIDALEEVYNTFASRYNLAVRRKKGGRDWNAAFSLRPWKDNRSTYVYYSGGRPTAAATVIYDNPGKTVVIRELVWLDTASLGGMLGFVRNSTLWDKLRIEQLPGDHPIEYMIANHNALERRDTLTVMARVLDIRRALELMRLPDGEGSFSVAVADGCIRENNGVFQVEFGGGQRRVLRREGSADMEADMPMFTRLALGVEALSGGQFDGLPGLSVNGNRDTLGRVFVKKPIFIGENF